MRVTELMEKPRAALVELLGRVQRSPELRPVGDRLFKLLGQRLAFDRQFEADLRETAAYYESWREVARHLGRLPDRSTFERVLEEGPPVEPETPAPAEPRPVDSSRVEPLVPAIDSQAETAPAGEPQPQVRYWAAGE
jgi:hypothetical protein